MDPSNTQHIQQLLELLQQAQCGNSTIQKPVEAKLKGFEKIPGFKTCLLFVAVGKPYEKNVRLLASILLKNACQRHWRKSKSLLKKDGTAEAIQKEKFFLKSQLLQHLDVDNSLVAKQLSVLTAKIAQWDWPNKWQNLFPILLKSVKSSSRIHVNRGLRTLHQVLKALVRRRMRHHRQQFEQAAKSFLAFVSEMWIQHTRKFLEEMKAATGNPNVPANLVHQLDNSANVALLFMKCLHRLIVYGIPNPDQHPQTQIVFPNILNMIQAFLSLRNHLHLENPLFKPVSKMIRVMARTVIEAQQYQPLAFRGFLVPFIQFFYGFIKSGSWSNGQLVFEKLSIQALTFLSRVISCEHYNGKGGLSFSATAGLKFDHAAVKDVTEKLNKVFTSELLQDLGRLLVREYFLTRKRDIEEWKENPEKYVIEELRAKESVRPASERLFMILIQNHKNVMGNLVLQMFQYVLGTCPPNPNIIENTPQYNAMLLKEAVYIAVGLSCDELHDIFVTAKVGFAQWYTQVLHHEVIKGPHVMRRRALWVIGEWASEISDDLRKRIYEDIVAVLQEDDFVLRLEAVICLENLLAHIDFQNTLNIFQTCLNPIISGLFQLISNVNQYETRIRIMHVIEKIVDHMGEKIEPAVGGVVQFLPQLWKNCEDQNLIRTSIISTVANVTIALKTVSVKLHAFVLPILNFATENPSDSHRAYLFETSLELWLSIVQNSPTLTQELSSVFNNWIHYYQHSVEHLPDALKVLESYVILGGADFFKTHGQTLSAILFSFLSGRIKNEGINLVCSVLERIAEMFPGEMPGLFNETLKHMVKDIVASSQKKIEAPPDKVIAGYYHVLARLIFQNCDGMMQFFSNLSQGHPASLISTVLDVWFHKFDCMNVPYRRKMSALAMCRCFVSTMQEIKLRNKLGMILTCCTSVLPELETANGAKYNSIFSEVHKIPPQNRTEKERILIMAEIDPCNKIDLRKYLEDSMNTCQKAMGNEIFAQFLNNTVDPLILQMLNRRPNA